MNWKDGMLLKAAAVTGVIVVFIYLTLSSMETFSIMAKEIDPDDGQPYKYASTYEAARQWASEKDDIMEKIQTNEDRLESLADQMGFRFTMFNKAILKKRISFDVSPSTK